jgi:hypothetical protein
VTRALAVLLAVVAAVTIGVSAASGEPGAAGSAGPPTTLVDNPFLPEDENLSDCISALPRPDCGSDSRGGWSQILVFALVVAGFAFIVWRVVRSVRRRDARGVPPRRPPVGRLDR